MKTRYLVLLGLIVFTCVGVACTQQEQTKSKATNHSTQRESQALASGSLSDSLENILLNDQNIVEVLTLYGKLNPQTEILLETTLGNIRIKLHTETPLHRANFLRLAKKKFFDGSEFHRVMPDFMIQGGGTDQPRQEIGTYTIPAEINPKFLHKRGAVAMAREDKNNPQKRSATHDFFIIQGKKLSVGEVKGTGIEYGFTPTQAQLQTYPKTGGCPHLDGQYTIFGEVTQGLDIVEKISKVKTDDGFWPIDAVKIKVRVL